MQIDLYTTVCQHRLWFRECEELDSFLYLYLNAGNYGVVLSMFTQ